MAETDPLGGEALSPEQLARVEAELTTGEQLLWVGRNVKPKHFGARLILGALLFLLCGGLMAVGVLAMVGYLAGFGWAFAAVLYWGLWCFGLFVGVGVLGGALMLAAYWRPRLYALTTQRAIIWAPWGGALFGSSVAQSYYPRQLEAMYRIEARDGRGSLIFEQKQKYGVPRLVGFLEIPRVREVERLMRERLLER